MPTDPTPERVREIAGFLSRNTRVLPGKEFAGDWIAVPEEDFVAARVRLTALAREVIALREIARDAVAEIENVERGYDANSESPPLEYVPGGPLLSLRARLDALVEQHNNGGES
jgi:hypothetical protein